MGARPGTVDAGQATGDIIVDVIRYRAGESERHRDVTPEQARELAADGWVTWVDVIGVGDQQRLTRIAELFELHLLVIDDVVTVPQRPKYDCHGNNRIFVVRMLGMVEGDLDLDLEQLSIVVAGDVLLTFQERPGDVLDPVRERIAASVGPIRDHGSDYLAYAIVDTIVDRYFPIIERLGEVLEDLEERIIEGAGEQILDELGRVRGVMLRLRRSVMPLRDSTSRMLRNDEFNDDLANYFRAVVDQLGQVADVLESYRDSATGLLNTHISVLAHRTNDVMRVLTVTASVFIPLTFIAGLYGMNFKNMPELDQPFGYPIALGVMLGVGGSLLWLFWRRGWLGRR